jgi:protein-L-isoaspartate(D-aspartate) O-methyltransferase
VESIEDSTRDVAIGLDDSGLATVSAMHAYATIVRLLDVKPGDRVLDLGAGTGYGAALLRELVGDEGEVLAVEIDPALVEQARVELDPRGVRCVTASALRPQTWPDDAHRFRKVAVGFCLDEIPTAWRETFAPGTVVVAPLRREGTQRMCRAVLHGDRVEIEWHHEVRFVEARTEAPAQPAPPRTELPPTQTSPPRHLPVVD